MEALQGSEIHNVWERVYHTDLSEQFFDKFFDWLVTYMSIPRTANVLDIGCGMGRHSVRLAQRGLWVTAADFSIDRIERASEFIADKGLQSRIQVQQEDLSLGLSFPPESFDVVLCWGVLMHIQKNERAMEELIRVTKPGGNIIVSESNLLSFDCMTSLLLGTAKNALGRGNRLSVSWRPYGVEYLTASRGGDLFVRHSRMGAIKNFFAKRGCSLRTRISGQFTESFTRFERTACGPFIHRFNFAWFKYVKLPYLACGNVLIFRRKEPRAT
jgi:2-polyprenyl-3-methyl-5-hydroxy-6-metoxy-1,4-benzoquinol methylase